MILEDLKNINHFNIYLNNEIKYGNSYSEIKGVATSQVKEGIYKIDYYNIAKKSLHNANDIDVIAEHFVNGENSIMSDIWYNKYTK